MLEAFTAARLDVARAYEQQGIMLTEHPLLDDSGDKEGSADPKPDGKNGRVAAILSLGTRGVRRAAAGRSEAAGAVRRAARRSSAASKG